MPLTRRSFLATSMLLPLITRIPAAATDVDWSTSAIISVFDMLPDRPGPNGLEFPDTTGMDHVIQQQVWPENPDMYWDPKGEDYMTIFGFHPSSLSLSASQGDVSIWKVPNTDVDLTVTRAKLEELTWEPMYDDLGMLHYTGSDDERKELAASLNMLNPQILEGTWDWIAIPDIATIVLGSDEELVRQVADRAKHYPSMSPIWRRFHHLKPLLQPETYFATLLSPQSLPVDMTTAAFVSKSWTGDVPIVQSIGLQLESTDQVEPMIETITQRLAQEVSPVSGTVYNDYLELIGTKRQSSSIRLDFTDASGAWDVTKAWAMNDLGMLPPR